MTPNAKRMLWCYPVLIVLNVLALWLVNTDAWSRLHWPRLGTPLLAAAVFLSLVLAVLRRRRRA